MFENFKNVFLDKGNKIASPTGARKRKVSKNELLDALDKLQVECANKITFSRDGVDDEHPFEGRLLIRLGCENLENFLHHEDKKNLDLVTQLFDFVLEDQNIPPQLRPLLGMLRVPYGKLSILDEGFFLADSHPAWRLLDNIARSVIGWSPEFENSENSLQRRIEMLISRVLIDFELDIQIFQEIDLDFSGYMKRHVASSLANEDRTVRVFKGTETLQAVQKRTAEEMAGRFEKNPLLPKIVQVILQDGWKNVLLMTGLRFGLDSKEWKKSVKLIGILIWSVAPVRDTERRNKLLRLMPKISTELRKGLESISYEKAKIDRLLGKLQTAHMACVGGQNIWLSGEGETTTALLGGSRYETPVDEITDDDPDLTRTADFFWMGKALPVGSWLETRENGMTKQRMKLAWKSEIADICLFVDRHGNKQMEIGYNQLAKMLSDGNEYVLPDSKLSFRERFMRKTRIDRQEKNTD